MTDQDIANYKKVVPDINKPENANKLIELVLLKTLERAYADTLLTAAQNQTNVSNFATEYKDIVNRVNNLSGSPEGIEELARAKGFNLTNARKNYTDEEILDYLKKI